MNVSPCYKNLNSSCKNLYSPKNNTIQKQNLNFTSIFADCKPANKNIYAYYMYMFPDMKQARSCATRIFRELPSQFAIAKILKPDEKSEIKILGCSDGSEAWAYAIALKEKMDKSAQENIWIKGIDIAPWCIDIAKSGRMVCSDIEKKYADDSERLCGVKNPLCGSGWDKYLIKSECPDSFCDALKKYPYIKYLQFDPVVNKSIGNGLDWYEINKDGLCDVTFSEGDMLFCLEPDKDAQNVVYVAANSAAYLLKGNPDRYIKLYEKIKDENKNNGKKVYVVIGDVENSIINPAMSKLLNINPTSQIKIKNSIQNLGFRKMDEIKLRKMGVNNYKDVSNKIYELK